MNNDDDKVSPPGDRTLDPKIAADWAQVEARRAELDSRLGGDARRQAILKRLGSLKHAS
jgi:hypothetical protein